MADTDWNREGSKRKLEGNQRDEARNQWNSRIKLQLASNPGLCTSHNCTILQLVSTLPASHSLFLFLQLFSTRRPKYPNHFNPIALNLG
uniref:Uncharacterized protein n=1 Tax=Arundo donax TaxID=35708 RepID=A0A0A9A7D5_ARUDO